MGARSKTDRHLVDVRYPVVYPCVGTERGNSVRQRGP